MPDDFATIAKITRPQGRNGEVAAVLLTDFPERFAARRRLFVLDQQGQRREIEVEHHWFHKIQVVLKLKGVDSISTAETLVGCEIQVPRHERAELEPGAVYVSELIGCTVQDAGVAVGSITDVIFGAGEAPLLVVRGKREYLIPLASEYVHQISLAERLVAMRLPEGMLELDAPLTAEEKQRQRSGH